MARQQQQQFEPDDRGYIAKNTERKNDKAPSHKGKITLTYETIKALVAQHKDGVEPTLYLAIWPGQKQGMLSVKAEPPQEYRQDEAPQRKVAKSAKRRPIEDDDEYEDDEIPF